MRRIGAAAAALAVVGMLSACERNVDGESEAVRESTIRESAEPALGDGTAPAEQPHPVVPVSPEGTATAVGDLVPISDSGVRGSITVRDLGGATLVSIEMSGVPGADPRLQAAIHRGTCAAPGPRAAELPPLEIGTGRIVSTSDTVNVPAATVMDGGHAVLVRVDGASAQVPPIACAEVPRIAAARP